MFLNSDVNWTPQCRKTNPRAETHLDMHFKFVLLWSLLCMCFLNTSWPDGCIYLEPFTWTLFVGINCAAIGTACNALFWHLPWEYRYLLCCLFFFWCSKNRFEKSRLHISQVICRKCFPLFMIQSWVLPSTLAGMWLQKNDRESRACKQKM